MDLSAFKDINGSLSVASVVGCIVQKSRLKKFSGNGKENIGDGGRSVFHIVLKNEELETIIVTFWDSVEDNQNKYDLLNWGDVIQINNAKVVATQTSQQPFTPRTSSQFNLQCDSTRGTICGCHIRIQRRLQNVLYSCFSIDHTTFNEITAEIQGTFINILALVTAVGERTKIRTKQGSEIMKLDLELADESLNVMIVTVWEEPMMDFMLKEVIPWASAIYIQDAYVKVFKAMPSLTITSKSLVTVNVNHPMATEACEFISQAGPDKLLGTRLSARGNPEPVIDETKYVFTTLELLAFINDKGVMPDGITLETPIISIACFTHHSVSKISAHCAECTTDILENNHTESCSNLGKGECLVNIKISMTLNFSDKFGGISFFHHGQPSILADMGDNLPKIDTISIDCSSVQNEVRSMRRTIDKSLDVLHGCRYLIKLYLRKAQASESKVSATLLQISQPTQSDFNRLYCQ